MTKFNIIEENKYKLFTDDDDCFCEKVERASCVKPNFQPEPYSEILTVAHTAQKMKFSIRMSSVNAMYVCKYVFTPPWVFFTRLDLFNPCSISN